jgi:hypothetical protein
MRRVTTILVAGLMVLAAFATPVAGAPTAPDSTATQSQAVTGDQGGTSVTAVEQTVNSAPDDPENDTIGWERGYWANESINVNLSDGLNQTEVERVKYRSMARLEVIRQLEYQDDVPVQIISREEYANNTQGQEVSDLYRQHFNVKFEATFMVNESADAVKVEQQNSAAGVGGFYSPSEDRIVIITENPDSPGIDEITLAQELYHALQDQYGLFENVSYETREIHNAGDGLVEGDANLADALYAKECANNSEWNCLEDNPGDGGGGLDLTKINFGLYENTYQPYSDGPAWVWEVYQDGGWEAVNDLYNNPPASTEQTIHPDRYPNDEPDYPTIEKTNSDNWEVPDLVGEQGYSVNYASFGEAGLYTMMWYPSAEEAPRTPSGQFAGRANVIIPLFNHFAAGPFSDLLINEKDTYNYDHPISDGWEGDKLVPYVPENSSDYEETGYVWQINFESGDEADEFLKGYKKLLKYHGAQEVESRENAYRIPDDKEFGDAFAIEQDDGAVTIVNAPSMSQIGNIHPTMAADYAGEDGDVSRAELQRAVSHFVNGKLDTDTFQKVVEMWVDG